MSQDITVKQFQLLLHNEEEDHGLLDALRQLASRDTLLSQLQDNTDPMTGWISWG